MRITYERSYYGRRAPEDPPRVIREAAERQAEFLHPARLHTLYARPDGRGFVSGARHTGADVWIVTYTPEDPTLPELDTIRQEERPTPPIADEPAFTLTAPISTRKGHQPGLFNGGDKP